MRNRIILFALALVLCITLVSAVPIEENGEAYDTPTAGTTLKSGIRIVALQNVSLINATVASCVVGATTQIYLQDASHAAIVNATVVGTTAVFLTQPTLVKDTVYYLQADAEGGTYTPCKKDPYTGAPQAIKRTNLNFTGDHVDDLTVFRTVEKVTTDSATNGSLSVSLDFPANGVTINTASYFNTTLTPASANTTNATLWIWYVSNNSVYNTSFSNVIGSAANKTGWNVSLASTGSFKWNVLGCGSLTNGVPTCSWASTNYTFSTGVVFNSNSSNLTTYESAYETYAVNVTPPTGLNISASTFYFNGTGYAGTTTKVGNNYILTRSIDIPFGVGFKNWYYQINYTDGSNGNLPVTNQRVSATNFTICGSAPYTVSYLNLSFKNETVSQELVKASLTSTWTYWLGSGSVNSSYTYNNLTDIQSYQFCGLPTNRTINAYTSLNYYNAHSQQKSFSSSFVLTNSTNFTTLYLLDTLSGIPVSFQAVDSSLAPISGVTVTVTRSGYGLIEIKNSDDAGLAAFFLDPLATYTVVASKTGYSTVTKSVNPTESSYTINLGLGTVTSSADLQKGITQTIYPQGILTNQTSYQFNLTLNSTFWTITNWGFSLYWNSTLIGNVSSTANGGYLALTANTGTNSSIRMEYFYVIDGNQTTQNVTWNIFDDTKTGYSIKNFATRLKFYLNNGNQSLFGLNGTSLNIIIFMVIIGMGGISAMKFGVDNPTVIVGIMTLVTFIFDVLLQLITYSSTIPSAIVPGASTLFLGLITGALFLREVTS